MSEPTFDSIYLSPHLDDAVLSCGGSIHRASRLGGHILVVTLFAGSPADSTATTFARELRARWGGAEDPVAARRNEDLAALELVGAHGLHIPFLDCVYRCNARGQALYDREASIFGDVHAEEAHLHEELLDTLAPTLTRHPTATIVSPLTIGHHVDHLLTFRVALALIRRGRTLSFYEDYPYAAHPDVIRRGIPNVPGASWHSETLPLDPEDLAAKGDGVACYASQISTFWPDLAAMRSELRDVALLVGGGRYAERIWRLAAATKTPSPTDTEAL